MLSIAGGFAAPSPAAVATHDAALTVQVGGHFGVGKNCDQETFRGCRDGESMRFQSPNLRVHRGDTLTFDFHGFHTTTFLPANTDLFHWIQSNTPGTGNPFSIFVPDPDDTPLDNGDAAKPSVKVNNAVQFPTDPACGGSDNPCSYDGTLLNSGFPQGEGPGPVTFSVEINANEGDVIWILCLVHPHMFMKVTVVGDNAATSTQADIDAARDANLAADMDWASAQDAALINKRASHVTAAGKRVYDVYAGVDNHRTSLNAMYPRTTTVPKGATVRFHFDELIYEHHTATMSFREGLERGREMFSPWCDEDTDSGAGPDEPLDEEGPPCGGDFSKFEVDIPSSLWNVSGNGVFTGDRDFENSGVRGGLQFSTGSFDVKFAKPSGRSGWRYFCEIHGPFMSGRVKVRR